MFVRPVENRHQTQPQIADAEPRKPVELVVKVIENIVGDDRFLQYWPVEDAVADRRENPSLTHPPRVVREVGRTPPGDCRVVGVDGRLLHSPGPSIEIVQTG